RSASGPPRSLSRLTKEPEGLASPVPDARALPLKRRQAIRSGTDRIVPRPHAAREAPLPNALRACAPPIDSRVPLPGIGAPRAGPHKPHEPHVGGTARPAGDVRCALAPSFGA